MQSIIFQPVNLGPDGLGLLQNKLPASPNSTTQNTHLSHKFQSTIPSVHLMYTNRFHHNYPVIVISELPLAK